MSRRSWGLCIVAAAALGVPGVAIAQGAKVTSAVEFARKADSLKPGEWVWAPSISGQGPVLVYVDVARQIATVYRNGVRIAVTTVSTGKPGHDTPTGVFTILQKDAHHRSSKYNSAPMPYQQRLTWDGVALHAGGLPGYPESHGCVHLPFEFSRQLFAITNMGGTVVVAGRAGSPPAARSAGVLSPLDDKGQPAVHNPLAPGEQYRWQPELAPRGPLTLVFSRSDQRVVVLRAGVEIGRARATMPAGQSQTHVYMLSNDASGKPQWLMLGVPGHADDKGKPLDEALLAQVRMPQPFFTAVKSSLQPGTTALVTDAPVLPRTTGQALTILASNDRNDHR